MAGREMKQGRSLNAGRSRIEHRFCTDDTMVEKREGELPKLGFHFASSLDKGVRVGKVTVPWTWCCYVNQRFCEEESFQKRTEFAVELVEAFVPPLASPVVVLADSAYCSGAVIEAVTARGFTLVGWVRKDRRLADERKAWNVDKEAMAPLRGMTQPVKVVHRGRGRDRNHHPRYRHLIGHLEMEHLA